MSLATRRRSDLLARLREAGGWRTVTELMWFDHAPDDRDPLRTFRLREASMRDDLRVLVRRGRAEVERVQIGSVVRLRYRAKEKP